MITDEMRIVCARRDASVLLRLLERTVGVQRRELMADMVLRWMLTTSPGYLTSDILENAYLELAKKIHATEASEFVPKTCLFVMSQAYISGGHTRWIEQWIDCERTRTYSLVFTRPVVNELPGKLLRLILERGGRVMCLPDSDRLTKALKLREIASKFESIIASPHQDDEIPLLAFGTVDFKRPIAFMNHANHMFWIGMSIADRIIDCGDWQQRMSLQYRGADETYNLPWMKYESVQDSVVSAVDRIAARKKLSIEESQFVVLTAAPSYKFRRVNGQDFTDVIKSTLDQCPRVMYYIVGMNTEERPDWEKLAESYGGRIRIHPAVPLDELKLYCAAADLYIDSFPFTSGGTVAVARMCGCPALTICKEFNYPSWMKCSDVDQLQSRIAELYNSPSALSSFAKKTNEFESELKKKSTRAYCQPILTEFINDLGTMKHSLRVFHPVVPDVSTNDYTILATRQDIHINRRLKRAIKVLSFGPESCGIFFWHIFNKLVVVCGIMRVLSGRIKSIIWSSRV